MEQYSVGLLGLGLRHGAPAGLYDSAGNSKQKQAKGKEPADSSGSHWNFIMVCAKQNFFSALKKKKPSKKLLNPTTKF